jgi:MoxR-like ATPase
MFHVKVDYPTREEEREIIHRTTSEFEVELDTVIGGRAILECQKLVRRVPVPDHVTDFVLDLVRGSRPDEPAAPAFVKELVEWGAGPRACQMLIIGGKVRAVLRRRLHVSIEDVEALAHPVLRHRLVPTFNAEAEGVTVDGIVDRILETVPRREPRSVL